MTNSTNFIEIEVHSIGEGVTQQHFGANYLAQLDNAAFESNESDFLTAANALGITDFRYPGGTIAEKFFDIRDGRHFQPNDGEELVFSSPFDNGETVTMVNLYDFLEKVQSSDGSATIVLPTIAFVEAINSGNASEISQVETTIKEFVKKCLTMPNGNLIGAFEIGNEFAAWLDLEDGSDNVMSSPVEFAKIMVNFSVWIDEVYQELGLENSPEILVQTPFVKYGGEGVVQYINHIMNLANEDQGVEALADAFAAIDGFTIHNYSTEIYSGAYGAIELDFQISDLMSDAFDSYLTQMGLPEKDYSVYITEWNVRNRSVVDLELDKMELAISLLDQFSQFVNLGADAMHVWPILHNTHNSLSEIDEDEGIALHIAGEVFASLQSNVVGMNAVETDTFISIDEDDDADFLFHAYQGHNETVVYITNVSGNYAEATFDLSELAVSNLDFEITFFSESEGAHNTTVEGANVELGIESETIAQIVFSEPSTVGTMVYYRDTLVCYRREDTKTPETLNGSDSDDVLEGSHNTYKINGFGGDDFVFGGIGNDTISGNEGNDTLSGGEGNDVIHSGKGSDQIIFQESWGNDHVSDFNASHNGDTLDFSQVSQIVSFNDLIEHHIATEAAGLTISDNLGNSVFLAGIGIDNIGVDHFLF